MIAPINATYFIRILMHLFLLVKRLARRRFNEDIDNDMLDKHMLPNHTLIMLMIT